MGVMRSLEADRCFFGDLHDHFVSSNTEGDPTSLVSAEVLCDKRNACLPQCLANGRLICDADLNGTGRLKHAGSARGFGEESACGSPFSLQKSNHVGNGGIGELARRSAAAAGIRQHDMGDGGQAARFVRQNQADTRSNDHAGKFRSSDDDHFGHADVVFERFC